MISWTIPKDILRKRPSAPWLLLSSTSAGVPARSQDLWSSRWTDLPTLVSLHSWATLKRCILLLGRNKTQGESIRKNQNEKPSVTTIEQPGFRKRNARREKQLCQKLPTKISLHLQLPTKVSLHLQFPSAASSPRVDFIFSEPAPADVSEDSNSSKMTIDGNVTLPSGEKKEPSKDDSNSTNHKLNPIDRKTSSQIYQSIPEESKASVRKLSKQRIKTILREFRQDRAATEAKYKGLRADEAVPVLTEELRIRGVPDYLIPIP